MELKLGTAQEAHVSSTAVERIRQRATSWVEEDIHQGLVLLAARRGTIFLHEAYGKQTPEVDGPAMPLDAIFPLASLTKPVSTTAAMVLVEEGLLGLNRPVQEYIPEFVGENKDKVLVHHLMTHTAGIANDEVVWTIIEERAGAGLEIAPQDENEHPEIHQILHNGIDIPLATTPGELMTYSSYGIQLLGEIIRRLSGQSLNEFVSTIIFTPLGMKDSTYSVPQALRSRVVIRPEHAPYPDFNKVEIQERPSPSGGAFSTVMDMAIFGQMFLNQGKYGGERILSPVTVAAMTRNQIPGIKARFIEDNFPEAAWGLGWSINAEFKGVVYGEALLPATSCMHGGAGGVLIWVDPEQDIIGVYFSVVMELLEGERPKWCADLFMNMVTAAVR